MFSSITTYIGKLTVRDIVVFTLCAVVLYLVGIKEQYSLVPKWRIDMDLDMYTNRKYPSVDEMLPAPIITDLESDGANDVIVITNEYNLRIYATDIEVKNHVLPEPKLKIGIQLPLNVSEDGRVSHPVAMSTGFLQQYKSVVQVRKQVIVIVTDDWNVLCFDHKLRLLWRTQLMNVGQVREKYYVKSMGLLVTSVKLRKKDRGLILVGGSFAHKIHKHTDHMLFGDEPVKTMSNSDVEDESLIHFTTFALSATDGAVRWHHLPGDFGETQTLEKDFESAHHWKLALKKGHLHKGEKPWTHYRYDFLKHLPHSWTNMKDTSFTLSNLKRSTDSRSNSDRAKASTLMHVMNLDAQHVMGYAYGGMRPHSAHEHVSDPNCLIIHNHQGVEVLNLVSGQPITKLILHSGQKTFADINGDGDIEEMAKKVHMSSLETGGTECDALVTQFKQSKTIFQSPLCDPAELTLTSIVSGKESFIEDPLMTLPPVVVNSIAKRTGIVGLLHHLSGETMQWMRNEKDMLFVTSNGGVVSYGPKGEVHWISKTNAKWSQYSRIVLDDILGDSVVKDTYRNAFKPSALPLSLKIFGHKNAILIVGWDMMSLVDLKYGNVLGEHSLPCIPYTNLVIGDFNGNGWSDVIVTCPLGYLGFSIEPTTNWKYAVLLRLAVLLGIAVLSWCCTPESIDDDDDYR